MQIWVNADACPKAIKEILFRVATRSHHLAWHGHARWLAVILEVTRTQLTGCVGTPTPYALCTVQQEGMGYASTAIGDGWHTGYTQRSRIARLR